jgi:hypothetical protein
VSHQIFVFLADTILPLPVSDQFASQMKHFLIKCSSKESIVNFSDIDLLSGYGTTNPLRQEKERDCLPTAIRPSKRTYSTGLVSAHCRSFDFGRLLASVNVI